MGDVSYFGKSGLLIQSGGELTTDRKGLVTGRMLFKVKVGGWEQMPSIGSGHPFASFCVLERRQVRMLPGFWLVGGDYVGCEVDESEAAWDFNPGTGNESLETHGDFAEKIAGKPSAPLNGAIWRDHNGDITEDDLAGMFERFKTFKEDATQNPWAGNLEYLAVNNTTWTKSWTRRSKPADATRPLRVVDSPPGEAPSYTEGNYNWLEFPTAFSKRGGVHDCRKMWMLSAQRGWNRVIYNGTETV